MPNKLTGKFSFEEVVSDSPCVIEHDLKKQIIKKRKKGGDLENAAVKRAELQAFELILKNLREIKRDLDELKNK